MKKTLIFSIIIALLVGAASVFASLYFDAKKQNKALMHELSQLTELTTRLGALPSISVQLNATMTLKNTAVMGKNQFQNLDFSPVWKDLVIKTRQELADSLFRKQARSD
jgi:hypothetical protein